VLEKSLKKFRFVNYMLAVFILFAILISARNIISMSFSKKEVSHVISEDNSLHDIKKKDIMQYSAILEKNPFGKPMKLEPIAVEQEKDKPYGALSDLILAGTVVGPKELSYAIFEDKSPSSPGGQDVFAYKENVFNYGVLTHISGSSVEIERDSVIYTVTFQPDTAGTDREEQIERHVETPRGSFAKKVGEQEYILDSRRVQKSLESPEQILTDARLLPNFVDGKQEGFRISEVVPDGLYHSLGLRNGDVLLKVNGLEISNPEVAMQSMTALRGMNRVNLDIIRKGKNMSMSYQIR
jgi:general secretion pathway protein C